MAITIAKLLRARTQRADNNGRTATREYMLAHGTANEAEQWLDVNAPATLTTWDSVQMNIESTDLRADDADETVWHATLDYSSTPRKEPAEPLSETVSFDLAAQSTTVTHSLSTTNSYAASGTAPNFRQGIAYDGESNKFNGADRMVEAFSFSITKIHPNSAITNAYIQSLRDAAFRWNSAAFRGNAIGECLFAGASGAPRDAENYSITYKFLSSKNATGLTIGPVTGVAKLGWDHLWVLTEKLNDTTGKFLTPVPKAVYVERLYTSVDFTTALGLSPG